MACVDIRSMIWQGSFHEQFSRAGRKTSCVLCHASKWASILREHFFNYQSCDVVVVIENLWRKIIKFEIINLQHNKKKKYFLQAFKKEYTCLEIWRWFDDGRLPEPSDQRPRTAVNSALKSNSSAVRRVLRFQLFGELWCHHSFTRRWFWEF